MRNSSLVKRLRAENVAGLKSAAEAMASSEINSIFIQLKDVGDFAASFHCDRDLRPDGFYVFESVEHSIDFTGWVGERSGGTEAVPQGAVELPEVRMPA